MEQTVKFSDIPIAHVFYARGLWWRKTIPWKGSARKCYNATRVHKLATDLKEQNFAFFDEMALVRYAPHQERIVTSGENVVNLSEARARLRRKTLGIP